MEQACEESRFKTLVKVAHWPEFFLKLPLSQTTENCHECQNCQKIQIDVLVAQVFSILAILAVREFGDSAKSMPNMDCLAIAVG